jgi:hypothetical protein
MLLLLQLLLYGLAVMRRATYSRKHLLMLLWQ